MPSLQLFSPVASAVHRMHLDALATYASAAFPGVSIDGADDGVAHALGRAISRHGVIFVQATGVTNILLLSVAAVLGRPVVYYLHEPTSLRVKLAQNPWLKSLVWHAVQFFDACASTSVLVSRASLIAQASTVYGLDDSRFTVAPLLMPEEACSDGQRVRRRVTYLGRIDDRRFAQEFVELAPALAKAGYRPTLLTGDAAGFQGLQTKCALPPELDVRVVTNFSETLKREVLNETLCIWNPKRLPIAQSGVTADALRFGCALILTEHDPDFSLLVDEGIAISADHCEISAESLCRALDRLDSEQVAVRCGALFSNRHGRKAFEHFYAPVFDPWLRL